ncbi:hypothetical protein BB934_45405 (plasmid) [Microvirga ossetica]|uniref:Uncharacterized protein n=1 Tax=Microvirga ossetica TaxID=1882682 RepID=A0A1B2EZN7_9HYPH|nr:hypothetical protein [Microvirga ossetica]ANY85459.1 hypothetical protein BB934_45405 [Microvirga ossetica]
MTDYAKLHAVAGDYEIFLEEGHPFDPASGPRWLAYVAFLAADGTITRTFHAVLTDKEDDPIGLDARDQLLGVLEFYQRHRAATGKRCEVETLEELDAAGTDPDDIPFGEPERLAS